MQEWREDYPWLQSAFKNWGGGDWRKASESWRVRIEDELDTTLDFKVRADGTATVWCGLSGHDFRHDPAPKELLEGLADCYRREVKRVGGGYPTQTRQWKMSDAVSASSLTQPNPNATVAVATSKGPVELSPAARGLLLQEITRRGSEDAVVRAFEHANVSEPISLDRIGKIVVFDALWALAEQAGGEGLIDPQLGLLRDRFREEIAQRSDLS